MPKKSKAAKRSQVRKGKAASKTKNVVKKPRNKSKPISYATKSFRKKTSKKFSIRQAVPKRNGKNLYEIYKWIELHKERAEKLKKDYEWWAFAIKTAHGEHNSYQVFGTLDLLINKLHQYKDIEAKIFDSDLPDAIKLIRWEGTPREHANLKELEVSERKERERKLAIELGLMKKKVKELERENKQLKKGRKKNVRKRK